MTRKGANKNFRQIILTVFTFVCKSLVRHLLGVKNYFIPVWAYWFFSHYRNFKQIKLNHNCCVGCTTVYIINKLMSTLFKNEILIQICFLIVKLHASGSQYWKSAWSGSEIQFNFRMKIKMRNLHFYQIENNKKVGNYFFFLVLSLNEKWIDLRHQHISVGF